MVQMNRALSLRQEEILGFISEYQRIHVVPPSTRLIQRRFGFGSQTSVVRHLRALAAKGAIEQLSDGSWGRRAREVQGLIDVAIFGSIPAGLPSAEAQDSLGSVGVDPAVFGISSAARSRVWALEIKGDSMIGAHICPGDIGLFESREPRPGEIVAALIDGATTLKRFDRVEGRAILRAENPAYPDLIPAEQLEAQGVLVGLLRRGSR